MRPLTHIFAVLRGILRTRSAEEIDHAEGYDMATFRLSYGTSIEYLQDNHDALKEMQSSAPDLIAQLMERMGRTDADAYLAGFAQRLREEAEDGAPA